jgi:hypothetical protein
MTTFSNYGQVNDRRQAVIIRSLGCEKPDLDHETALAGLQELLRPGLIQALSDALASSDVLHDPLGGHFGRSGFLAHLYSLKGYDEPEILSSVAMSGITVQLTGQCVYPHLQ